MIRRGLIILVLIFMPLNVFCDESSTNFDIGLRPSVLNQRDDNDYSAALEFNVFARHQPYTGKETTYRKTAWLEFRSEALLVADEDLNSNPLRAEALLGGSLNMSGPKLAERGKEEGEEVITQYPFNYGRLSAGFIVGYETDQSLDHRNFTVGSEFAYVLTENEGLKALVPSIFTAYEWVSIDKSELQEKLNVDNNNYYRFRIAASWKLPIEDYLPKPLKPLSFHMDVRHFKDEGRPDAIKDDDRDEATYVAATLNYTFEKPILFKMLSGIFLKVSDGRIPPATEDSTQIHLGVTLLERER